MSDNEKVEDKPASGESSAENEQKPADNDEVSSRTAGVACTLLPLQDDTLMTFEEYCEEEDRLDDVSVISLARMHVTLPASRRSSRRS